MTAGDAEREEDDEQAMDGARSGALADFVRRKGGREVGP